MRLSKKDLKHKAANAASLYGTAMPTVTVYPICSACGAPYVLRHALVIFENSERWLWQRDCKHKKAPPAVNPGNASASSPTKSVLEES